MDEINLEVEQVKTRIGLALKDDKVSYAVAITAMAKLMLEIAVLGCGKEEQDARAFCSSMFSRVTE